MIERLENNQKQRIVVILFVTILLVAACFISQYYVQGKTKKATVISGEFLPEQKDAQKISTKEMTKLAQSALDKSKFNLIILPEAKFCEKTLKGNLKIKNPSNNSYPINVEIREKMTDRLIYTSGAIEPGYEVKEVTLEQKLKKGDYPSVALFSLYDPITKEKKEKLLQEST